MARSIDVKSNLQALYSTGINLICRKTQSYVLTPAPITFHKFNYWVRKFDSGESKGNSSSSGFLSVAIKQPATDCRIEIIRTDGTRIQFHGAVEAGFIKSLLDFA